ncbi:hypothetical protein GCM10009839_19880 [Catenulispora yoronensis]|uniref:Uncharacterized protein n=1 Tax=Catenulispora yoronensis TaxID=450799 RepID=A0ABP5FFL8_9ACTN
MLPWAGEKPPTAEYLSNSARIAACALGAAAGEPVDVVATGAVLVVVAVLAVFVVLVVAAGGSGAWVLEDPPHAARQAVTIVANPMDTAA